MGMGIVVEELRKGKMKCGGGKEDEKRMEDHHPIFPRLHISDTERRGPKAPPRNKMAALSETQHPAMSLPPIPMLPLPLPNSSALSHAASPFYYPPSSSHSYSSVIHFTMGEPSFTTPRSLDLAPLKYESLSDNKGDFPSTSCHSLSAMKLENGGRFSAQKFPHTGKHPKSENIQKILEKEKDTFSSSSFYQKNHNSSEKVIQKRNHLGKERYTLEDEYDEDYDEYAKNAKTDKKRSASVMEGHHKEISHADRNEEIPYASAINLSPDDVVKILGHKLFWKARRTIMHQQRTFSLQIFELHRLIKVQKMVSRSPDILFEDDLFTGKSHIKSSFFTKKLPPNNVNEPPTPVVERNSYSSQKPKGILGIGLESSREKMPDSGTRTLTSPDHDAKWYFQPPYGNQWLVPVRSPSEGLVYKPYSGPCPPPGGILAPLYGGCRPYGIGLFSSPPYFQPYALPVISPSVRDTNLGRPCEKKVVCNNGAQSRILSNGAPSLQTDRGSDLQGSTASSPSERVLPDALSLFPTKPTGEEDSDQPILNQVRVIKVVPHNPNTTSESAARILKSMQEERKQH
ncbi:unnamed protein product [Cuscuta epithymum]|uniref:Protein EARLY FLOWERING 3-like n=1 Tax=Cuscuta epithymum TaxID=186058 RepID=A0AAV0C731_9ASTE|nr:unnamed protein product [Cuscuta epithymum]